MATVLFQEAMKISNWKRYLGFDLKRKKQRFTFANFENEVT